MGWIVAASIINVLWTLWCVRLLPARVATKFGLGGQPEGYMSRKAFAWFSILFPLPMAYFIVFTTSLAPGPAGMAAAMDKFAAGFILFFSCISWCLVRSNRKSPPRMDFSSLWISLLALAVFSIYSLSGITKGASKSKQVSSTATGSSR